MQVKSADRWRKKRKKRWSGNERKKPIKLHQVCVYITHTRTMKSYVNVHTCLQAHTILLIFPRKKESKEEGDEQKTVKWERKRKQSVNSLLFPLLLQTRKLTKLVCISASAILYDQANYTNYKKTSLKIICFYTNNRCRIQLHLHFLHVRSSEKVSFLLKNKVKESKWNVTMLHCTPLVVVPTHKNLYR